MINKQEQLDYLKRRIKDLDEHIARWETTLISRLENPTDTESITRAENYLQDKYAEKSRWAQRLRMVEKEPDGTEFKDYL